MELDCYRVSRGLPRCEECNVILKVPDLRQTDGHSCGLCALNSVLTFHGRKPVSKIGSGLPSKLDGIEPRAIEMAARGLGLSCVSGQMTLDDLRHYTRSGRPVIVLVQFSGGGHYQIVKGIVRRTIYLQCPVSGGVTEREADFAARWHDYTIDAHRLDNFGIACGAS